LPVLRQGHPRVLDLVVAPTRRLRSKQHDRDERLPVAQVVVTRQGRKLRHIPPNSRSRKRSSLSR